MRVKDFNFPKKLHRIFCSSQEEGLVQRLVQLRVLGEGCEPLSMGSRVKQPLGVAKKSVNLKKISGNNIGLYRISVNLEVPEIFH